MNTLIAVIVILFMYTFMREELDKTLATPTGFFIWISVIIVATTGDIQKQIQKIHGAE
jgi:hypothetical protein